MNDIFKLFKKRAQSGKTTNITDVIKDLNEKEQNEIMGSDGVGKFERGSKSYLSISKSGRLKSKKSQSSRALQDDLFNPVSSKLAEIAARENRENQLLNNIQSNGINRNVIKKSVYDQNSDNADSSRTSSTSSSFRSSFEDIPKQGFNSKSQIIKKQMPNSNSYQQSGSNYYQQSSHYHQTSLNRNIQSAQPTTVRNNMRYVNTNVLNNSHGTNGFKRF